MLHANNRYLTQQLECVIVAVVVVMVAASSFKFEFFVPLSIFLFVECTPLISHCTHCCRTNKSMPFTCYLDNHKRMAALPTQSICIFVGGVNISSNEAFSTYY